MFFDEEGRLKDFVAKRYNTNTRQYEVWSTPIIGYGEFEGLRLPIKGMAVWKLKEGDFAYIDVTITDLEYDVSNLY